MVKKWITNSKEFLKDFRIFKTYRVQRESQDSGKIGDFFIVEPPRWIMVIPIIKDSEGNDSFLMVRQYRHGSDSITLEFPAGMVEVGEKSITAAARELQEETGYSPGSIVKIGQVNPNPAFMTNYTTTYLATNLTKVDIQKLDEHEEIDFVTVPIKEFDNMISEYTTAKSEVNSAITLQAYLFYLKYISK